MAKGGISLKIQVFENNVLNLQSVLDYYNNNGKYFLIDEGADIKHIMIGNNMPLFKLLQNKNITIETYNLIQKDIEGVVIKKQNILIPFLYYQQKKLFEKEKEIEKHFGLFVGGSRWHRLFLASNLFNNYNDKSIISYRQTIKNKNQNCNLYMDELFLRSFKLNNNKFINDIFNFVLNLPLEVTTDTNSNTGYINFDEAFNISHLYKKIFVDVVCETWHEGDCFYPTEKTSRAIVCHTPFIVYGGKSFLKNLRNIGFKTFNKFWDESYDNYSGIDRILMINKLEDTISKLSIDDLKKMYNEMKEILDHNYKTYNNLLDVKIL